MAIGAWDRLPEFTLHRAIKEVVIVVVVVAVTSVVVVVAATSVVDRPVEMTA